MQDGFSVVEFVALLQIFKVSFASLGDNSFVEMYM